PEAGRGLTRRAVTRNSAAQDDGTLRARPRRRNEDRRRISGRDAPPRPHHARQARKAILPKMNGRLESLAELPPGGSSHNNNTKLTMRSTCRSVSREPIITCNQQILIIPGQHFCVHSRSLYSYNIHARVAILKHIVVRQPRIHVIVKTPEIHFWREI